jgi:hypothetical protein
MEGGNASHSISNSRRGSFHKTRNWSSTSEALSRRPIEELADTREQQRRLPPGFGLRARPGVKRLASDLGPTGGGLVTGLAA